MINAVQISVALLVIVMCCISEIQSGQGPSRSRRQAQENSISTSVNPITWTTLHNQSSHINSTSSESHHTHRKMVSLRSCMQDITIFLIGYFGDVDFEVGNVSVSRSPGWFLIKVDVQVNCTCTVYKFNCTSSSGKTTATFL